MLGDRQKMEKGGEWEVIEQRPKKGLTLDFVDRTQDRCRWSMWVQVSGGHCKMIVDGYWRLNRGGRQV